MTDDIVTRLRAVPTRGNGMCCGSNSTVPNPYYNRCQEAADEIERLWSQVDALKSMISPNPNPEYRYFVHPDAASTYAQLLRGEFND